MPKGKYSDRHRTLKPTVYKPAAAEVNTCGTKRRARVSSASRDATQNGNAADPGEHITSTKRLAIRRFTATVSVARCSTAGPSPRRSAATYGPPLGFARLVCVA
eukprot:6128718-Prymnesium_polylepis.1